MSRSARVVIALLCAMLAAPAHADDDVKLTEAQKLVVYAKPAVVRIVGAYVGHVAFQTKMYEVATGGLGTGFFVSPDGYLATNAHVVQTIHDGDDKAREALKRNGVDQIVDAFRSELARESSQAQANDLQFIQRNLQLVDMQKLAYIVLPNGDHLPYDVKAYGAPIGEGKDCAVIKVVTDNAPTLALADSTKVVVQEHLFVIGYPGVADLKGILTKESQFEASVTSGTVSAIKRDKDGEQVIQTDAAIAHGNSGGPAIDDSGAVIGLATFGDAQEVQGFHFLVSSQEVMEFVRQAGAKPSDSGGSLADTLWHDGLDLFWNAEYTDAIAKFEELRETYPAHPMAADYIKQARAAIRDGKEKKPASNVGLVIGLIALGVVLAAGAILLLLGRGKPRAAAQPSGQLPVQPQAAAMQTPMTQPMPGQSVPMQTPYTTGGVAPQPFARTFAIQPPPPVAGQVAPTAFGSLAMGGLTCTRGVLTGQRFALSPTGIIIGRQPGVAHVVVNDHRASGKHVWIGFDNGKLVAIDQGTTNGTYINDVSRGRITRAELRDGDIVIVGEPDCCSLQVKLTA